MKYDSVETHFEFDLKPSLSYEILEANSYSSMPNVCFVGRYGLMESQTDQYFGGDLRISQSTGLITVKIEKEKNITVMP